MSHLFDIWELLVGKRARSWSMVTYTCKLTENSIGKNIVFVSFFLYTSKTRKKRQHIVNISAHWLPNFNASDHIYHTDFFKIIFFLWGERG